MSGPLRLTVYAMVASLTSALALSAVYSSNGWLVPALGGVVLVSGSCALIRWSPLPSLLESLTAAVAVLLWVTWLYARHEAKFGFLPDGASLRHLNHLARAGFTDIRKLPPPVPAHQGLVLITVIGVAVVALVVDLLAVTLRRAALAGLPLLSLYTVCAATSRNGVNVMAFIPAAAGYLMLLYADNRERVTRWGAAMGSGLGARPAPTRSAESLLPSAPASLGRRVGAAAIGISAIVPFLVPGIHDGFGDHHHGGNGSGHGPGSVTTIDPIVSVNQDLTNTLDAPVLSYTTTAPNPGYLRMTSLDDFANGTFTASALNAEPQARVSNGLGVIAPSTQSYTTQLLVAHNFAFRWLPMPTVATAVTVNGDWRYDPVTSTVFSAADTTADLRYTVVSSPDLPTPAELSRADQSVSGLPAQDLAAPDIAAAVRQLTTQVTAHAQTNFDAALDIQRYLTSSLFHYTTHPPAAPQGDDPLTFFLTVSHRGFCQQYATAMAVMARLVGIPSRVAVGFTAGKQQADGSWLVTSHDAHAWPELYFPGYGWLPFEPTPRGDGQAVIPSYAHANPNGGNGSGAQGGGGTPKGGTSKPPTTGNHREEGATGGLGGAATATNHSGLESAIWLAVVALLGAALVMPSAARQVTRRRRLVHSRGAHPLPAAAWAELRDSAIDAGGPWDDMRSPRQAAYAIGRWLNATAEVRTALGRLTRAEEEHRYAQTPMHQPTSLDKDLKVVRSALRSHVSYTQNARAVLLPPSTLRRLTQWSAELAERIDARRDRRRVRVSRAG